MKQILLAFFMMLALTSFNFTKDTRKSIMIQEELEIKNVLGLDVRASAKLSQLAAKYSRCNTWLTYNNRRVRAKEIMGVQMLQAKKGARILVECEGENEEECFNAIKELIDKKFGYEE